MPVPDPFSQVPVAHMVLPYRSAAPWRAAMRRHLVLLFGIAAVILCVVKFIGLRGAGLSGEAHLPALSSTAFYTTIVASTTIMAAVLSSMALDAGKRSRTAIQSPHQPHSLTPLLLLLSALAYGSIVLGFAIPHLNASALWLGLGIRDITATVAVLYSLRHSPFAQWSERSVVTIALLACIHQVAMTYNVRESAPDGSLSLLTVVAGAATCSLLAIQCVACIRSKRWSMHNSECTLTAASMCALVLEMTCSLLAGIVGGPNEAVFASTTFLCVREGIHAACVLVLCSLYNQCEQEKVEARVEARVLEAQAQCERTCSDLQRVHAMVRYASHEVRTPLNTAALGLTLVRQLLQATTQAVCAAEVSLAVPGDVRRAQMSALNALHDIRGQLDDTGTLVEETEQSVLAGVTILSDLLTYEKLQGEVLMLDAHVAYITPLLLQTVRAFQPQARACGVTISLQCEGVGVGLTESETLPTDKLLLQRHVVGDVGVCLLMDESKVAQVIRNLVSNALKFSPAGATVHITTSTVTRTTRLTAAGGSSPQGTEHATSTSLPTYTTLATGGSGTSNGAAGSGAGAAIDAGCTSDAAVSVALATPPGTGVCAGTTSSCVRTNVWRLQVQDAGSGLTAHQQARLFKEVVQFNPGKLQGGGGSGLGLYIAHGIAVKHGGTLTVTSQGEGCGTTFVLELPIHTSASAVGSRTLDVTTTEVLTLEETTTEGPISGNAVVLPLFIQMTGPVGLPTETQRIAHNESSPAVYMHLACDSDSNSGAISVVPLVYSPQPSSDVETMILAGWEHDQQPGADCIGTTAGASGNMDAADHEFAVIDVTAGWPLRSASPQGNRMAASGELSSHHLPTPFSRLASTASSIWRAAPAASTWQGTTITAIVSDSTTVAPGSITTPLTPDTCNTGTLLHTRTRAPSCISTASLGSYTPAPYGGLRVLIVDDSASTRRMVARMLRANGLCECAEEADSGESALARMLGDSSACISPVSSGCLASIDSTASPHHHPYDVVLMDADMPRLDGLTAMKRARTAGYTGFVLGMTGNTAKADTDAFLAAGVDRVLTKPLALETAVEAIRIGITARRGRPQEDVVVPLIGATSPLAASANPLCRLRTKVVASPSSFSLSASSAGSTSTRHVGVTSSSAGFLSASSSATGIGTATAQRGFAAALSSM